MSDEHFVAAEEYNEELAKLIRKNIKKSVPSIFSTRQGFKGQGVKSSHRRQIWLYGHGQAGDRKFVDVWLVLNQVEVGGVCIGPKTHFSTKDLTPQQAFNVLVEHLRARGF